MQTLFGKDDKAKVDKFELLAGIGTWRLDLTSESTEWSSGMFSIFGLDSLGAAPVFSNLARYLTADSFERVSAAVRDTVDTGAAFELELEVVRPENQRGYLLTRGELVRDADGRASHVRGIALDITERKEAQIALGRGEERLRQILEHAGQAFYSHTVDNTFLYVSPQFETVLDCKPEDVPSMWTEFLTDHPLNAEGVEATRLAIETGVAQKPYVLELKTPRGRVVWVEVHESPVVVDGRTIAVVGALTDITNRLKAEEALRHSVAEFRTLAESLPQIVWVTRPDGWHTHFNKKWLEYTGLTMTESLGHGWNPPFHPDDRTRAAERWRSATESGEPYEIEYRLRRHDGVYRWMLGRALPMRDANGKVTRWFGTCTDIDDLKRAEEALAVRARQQVLVGTLGRAAIQETNFERLFSTAVSHVASGLQVDFTHIALRDESGGFVLKAGVGWNEEWIGRRVSYLPASEGPANVDDFFDDARLSSAPELVEHGIVSGIAVSIGGGQGSLGVLSAFSGESRPFSTDDIAFMQAIANTLGAALERAEIQERLIYLARHDSLTELPNRLLLLERLQAEIARSAATGSGLALLFIDLDRFKSVNDVFGHSIGDQVIHEAATRLTGCMRSGDMVSRHGGDEFIVLLPDVGTEQDAARIARKVMSALTEPFHLKGREVSLSASLGITFYPQDGADADALLSNADAAMYASKERGRNGFQFYSANMNARAAERLSMEADLRRAAKLNQFFVVYQPQIDMASDTVCGVEALLRWRHPEQGLIPPDRFIPIAEECGLIVEIGAWVLDAATRQHARWISDGTIQGAVAVNVSAYQFRQPDFVDTVAEVLEQTGLSPEFLELEVTERIVMHDIDDVRKKLEQLRSLGILIAIDDFGTGYSSLSYLKQFPIGRLKIDQSFTRGLPEDRESTAIAQAVISMGHSLGMQVVAEGTETREQATQLKAMACDVAQGYLYAKPMPAEDCTAYLLAHRQRRRDV